MIRRTFPVLVVFALVCLYVVFDAIRVVGPPANAVVYVDLDASQHYLSPPCLAMLAEDDIERAGFLRVTVAEARARFKGTRLNPRCGAIQSVSLAWRWLQKRGWVAARWNDDGSWNW